MLRDEFCSSDTVHTSLQVQTDHDQPYKFWAPSFSYNFEVLGSYLLCNGPLEKVKYR